jgi:ABC-2 type transport system ATP-binding protein
VSQAGTNVGRVNAIEVSGLRKSYGNFEAVRGISFTVPAGQVVAFLGPNGAGKTTTVEILEGYRARTEGTVSVLGEDPGQKRRTTKDRIGIVLQECGFPRYATVKELVTLYAGYYNKPRNVDEVIKIVGLEEKTNSIVRSLSGGQQRRLDVALALIGDPDLLFLDEPTTGFDPNARRESWDTIAGLRDLGKTIFLTTHYMDEAQYLADHVIVIAGGEIVAEGSPDDLGGRDVAATEIRFVLPAGKSRADLPALDQAEVEVNGESVLIRSNTPTRAVHALTGWALEANLELFGLSVTKPSLEDVYLTLTADDKATV